MSEDKVYHLTAEAFPSVTRSRLHSLFEDGLFQHKQALFAYRDQARSLIESGQDAGDLAVYLNEQEFDGWRSQIDNELMEAGWTFDELAAGQLVVGGVIDIDDFGR